MSTRLYNATVARQSKNAHKKRKQQRTKRANVTKGRQRNGNQRKRAMPLHMSRLQEELETTKQQYQKALKNSRRWRKKYKKLSERNDFNNAIRVIQHDINKLSCLIA